MWEGLTPFLSDFDAFRGHVGGLEDFEQELHMAISFVVECVLRARFEGKEKREMRGKVERAYYLVNLGSPFDRHLDELSA